MISDSFSMVSFLQFGETLNLKFGMSKSEVLSVLGEPSLKEEMEQYYPDIWWYNDLRLDFMVTSDEICEDIHNKLLVTIQFEKVGLTGQAFADEIVPFKVGPYPTIDGEAIKYYARLPDVLCFLKKNGFKLSAFLSKVDEEEGTLYVVTSENVYIRFYSHNDVMDLKQYFLIDIRGASSANSSKLKDLNLIELQLELR